jgi:hypothetical protein
MQYKELYNVKLTVSLNHSRAFYQPSGTQSTTQSIIEKSLRSKPQMLAYVRAVQSALNFIHHIVYLSRKLALRHAALKRYTWT